MKPYEDFPALAAVYLEDSYVLGVDESPDSVSFRLDAVLTPQHPRYREPLPGEQYCYVDAILTVGRADTIEWLARSDRTYTDASGEQDLGNIDSFCYDEGHFDIDGDWGHVRIHTTAEPELTLG